MSHNLLHGFPLFGLDFSKIESNELWQSEEWYVFLTVKMLHIGNVTVNVMSSQPFFCSTTFSQDLKMMILNLLTSIQKQVITFTLLKLFLKHSHSFI
jgi:hypothetical protein